MTKEAAAAWLSW